MRLRLTAAAGLALAAALVVPGQATAAAPSCKGLPAHSNLPVVDAARVLEPQRMAFLTGDLMRFAMDSDVAVVAATVPDLAGDDVSSYARRLFDCWGVGDADSDRGVLILVAMRERRVRIELGRGLANDIDRAELGRAVGAMTAPLRAGNVHGALRAAAVEIATAVGKTLPDLEQFVRSNGKDASADFGIPESIIRDAVPGGTGVGGDAPPAAIPGRDQIPGIPNPFRSTDGRDNTWIPKAVLVVLVVAAVTTFARAAFRGGMRLANVGQTAWRGGFPTFGGGARGWGDPTLLQQGQWSQPGSGFSGGAPLSSSGTSGGASSPSGGSGGGSFGGGSSGGGGASGSW